MICKGLSVRAIYLFTLPLPATYCSYSNGTYTHYNTVRCLPHSRPFKERRRFSTVDINLRLLHCNLLHYIVGVSKNFEKRDCSGGKNTPWHGLKVAHRLPVFNAVHIFSAGCLSTATQNWWELGCLVKKPCWLYKQFKCDNCTCGDQPVMTPFEKTEIHWKYLLFLFIADANPTTDRFKFQTSLKLQTLNYTSFQD